MAVSMSCHHLVMRENLGHGCSSLSHPHPGPRLFISSHYIVVKESLDHSCVSLRLFIPVVLILAQGCSSLVITVW